MHSHEVLSWLDKLVVHLTKGVAHATAHHSCCVTTVIEVDGGIGHTLTLAVIHLALHTILLRHGANGTNHKH